MVTENSVKKISTNTVPLQIIERRILVIRGMRVMIDADLAELYGVSTMQLNQAVRRNFRRFPSDFMFQLSASEKAEVITNCDNLTKLKFSHHLPHVFTEHGVAMLSSVLRSERAVQVNIFIIRAFIKIREILASNKELAYKVEEMEREQRVQNRHINAIYSILDKLIAEPVKSKSSFGFVK
jgi:hypothetical protein